MIAWLTTTLRHLTVAWLAASSLYLVGVERLPTAWLTVALSTYLGLAVGLFDHVSGRHERRLVAVPEVAAPPPAPAPPRSAAPPPPRSVTRAAGDTPAPPAVPTGRRPSTHHRIDDPFRQRQCPNCGGFAGVASTGNGSELGCPTCHHRWAPTAALVEIRSWLHHT